MTMEERLQGFTALMTEWSRGFFMTPLQLANLITMEELGTINNATSKKIFNGCWDYGKSLWTAIQTEKDIDLNENEWAELYWSLNRTQIDKDGSL